MRLTFWNSLERSGVLGRRIRSKLKERQAKIAAAIRHTYCLALYRHPSAREVASWTATLAPTSAASRLAAAINAIATSAEAGPVPVVDLLTSSDAAVASTPDLLPAISNGRFIQLAHEILLQRGAFPGEIIFYDHCLEHGLTRNALVTNLFRRCATSANDRRHGATEIARALSISTPGSGLTVQDWQTRAHHLHPRSRVAGSKRKSYSRFPLISKPSMLVTAITSLYKGGAFISHFMQNISSQTIFKDYCELIIIDANSPENEYDVIKPYLERLPNILYFRTPTPIRVYEAWNLAISKARGRYITTANVDDLRRIDSFELQAGALDNVEFADIVYQDVLYSFDASLGFEDVAAFEFEANFPVVCPSSLLSLNSPHNAPMWRRSLHDEVGLFDSSYTSAGDWEFWIRCIIAGKQFYKLNDPHVVYFVNPDAVSTRQDARRTVEKEENEVRRVYARRLVSEHLVSHPDRFMDEVTRRSALKLDISDRTRTKNWRYAAVQRALRQMSATYRQ